MLPSPDCHRQTSERCATPTKAAGPLWTPRPRSASPPRTRGCPRAHRRVAEARAEAACDTQLPDPALLAAPPPPKVLLTYAPPN